MSSENNVTGGKR